MKFPLNINSQLLDNWTALHLATNEGYLIIMEKLIDSGANIEAGTTIKRTPMHIAALRGNIYAMKKLVMKSAKVNAQDDDDNTPLHIASERGYGEIVEFLLENNADPKKLNTHKKTPVDLSLNEKTRRIYDKFLKEEEKYEFTDLTDGKHHSGRSEQVNRFLYQAKISKKSMESDIDIEKDIEDVIRTQSVTQGSRIKEVPMQNYEPQESHSHVYIFIFLFINVKFCFL